MCADRQWARWRRATFVPLRQLITILLSVISCCLRRLPAHSLISAIDALATMWGRARIRNFEIGKSSKTKPRPTKACRCFVRFVISGSCSGTDGANQINCEANTVFASQRLPYCEGSEAVRVLLQRVSPQSMHASSIAWPSCATCKGMFLLQADPGGGGRDSMWPWK
jgi:hypothetical protein